MIEAWLYLGIGVRLPRSKILEEAVNFLRIKAAHPLEEETVREGSYGTSATSATTATTGWVETDASSTISGDGITMRYRKPHLIFKRWKKLGKNRYAYLLDGLADFRAHSLRASEPGVLNIGFDEPDEKVNLQKLAEKFRDSAPVKELLIKYYNRN